MANSVIGQIISIGQTQSLTSKSGAAFTKRDVVISIRRFDPNTGEPVNDYENTPLFSFMGERCKDLDQFQVGQNVEIFFDLSGRKYTPENGTEKIINDIRPYKIELYGRQAAAAQAPQTTSPVIQSGQNYPAQPTQPYQTQPVTGNQQDPFAPTPPANGGFTPKF